MSEKIRLRVEGITVNSIKSGAYVLLLREYEGGRHRVPVLIGAAEAQSIAARLEGVTLPRPLVHEMMQSTFRAFGIVPREVLIYKFAKGVFYAEITFSDGDREVVIDSRTSDAIALAIRCKTPIYATPEVMKVAGIEVQEKDVDYRTPAEEEPFDINRVPLEKFAVEELEKMLQDCIKKELYERAAEIKQVLERKGM